MVDLFFNGLASICTPSILGMMALGVVVGIIFGSVPGLTR